MHTHVAAAVLRKGGTCPPPPGHRRTHSLAGLGNSRLDRPGQWRGMIRHATRLTSRNEETDIRERNRVINQQAEIERWRHCGRLTFVTLLGQGPATFDINVFHLRSGQSGVKINNTMQKKALSSAGPRS